MYHCGRFDILRCRVRLEGLLFISVFCLLWPSCARAKETRRVLIINALGPMSPAYARMDEEIRTGLDNSPYQVELYHEYLETVLLSDNLTQKKVGESIIQKYQNRKIDLIIAVGLSALRFMNDSHRSFFPNTPVVFCGGVEELSGGLKPDPQFVGVWMVAQPTKTLDLALDLEPHTQHVVVVGGIGKMDRLVEAFVREQFKAYEARLQFNYLTDLSMLELLDRLRHLPTNSIVIYTGFSQDATGTRFIDATQSLPMVTAAATAPVFVMSDILMDHGSVGGYLIKYSGQGKAAAAIATRVLNGERPEDIRTQRVQNDYMFDWAALQRWKMDTNKLPPGSIVLNRQLTLWQVYRGYIIGGISLCLTQMLLILALLWQRARKRKVEAVLRESEKRFRVMADTTPALIWMCDEQGKVTYLNEQRVLFTGSDPYAGYGDTWTGFVHPDDVNNVLDSLDKALKIRQPFSKHYRLHRRDGAYRWMFDVASPRVNGDGSFAGFIGSAVDVTDQKMAQEALEKISGQLIDAQEKERSRLARELHDDICQRLAMLSLKIEKVTKGWGHGQSSVPDQLEQIWQQCSKLTGDVQALSHELHPSILENLGLVTAVKSYCRELSEQSGVVVEFSGRNMPGSLPREVSLSLFRVVQEALRNAVKYSGQTHFQVRLQEVSEQLELEVSDQGIGFDTSKTKNGGGLGLVSMAERIHQVNGTFKIDSQPNGGTKIRAAVPIESHSNVVASVAN